MITGEKHCKFCDKAYPATSDHWKVVRGVYLECKAQAKAQRQKKRRQENLEKYGTETPRKSKEFHELVSKKRQDTMQKRHGVNNPMQAEALKNKQRKSLMESFGVDAPSKSETIKQKIKETNLERYGKSTNLQIAETVEKAKKSKQEKFSILLSDGTRLRDFCDAREISRAWAYKVFKYGGEKMLVNYAANYSKRTSNLELEFIELMKDFKISLFNRHPAPGVQYRPDFFLERDGKGLYVNVDGMYFHCEARQPDPEYHRKMRRAFEQAGLRLMQFTGAEIMQSPEIIRSMILSYFGQNEKVYARDCEIAVIGSQEASEFFNNSHLMGAHPASSAWGLRKDGFLVACMSARIRKGLMFIERFSSVLGKTVTGGFSRLTGHISKISCAENIISYCDLRYATGSSYSVCGFEKISESLGFTWTDGVNIFNRLHCRANMDDRKLSETEHAVEMKLFRLYDAGQAKYVKRLKK